MAKINHPVLFLSDRQALDKHLSLTAVEVRDELNRRLAEKREKARTRTRARVRGLTVRLARLLDLDPATLPAPTLVSEAWRHPDDLLPLISVDGVTFGPARGGLGVALYRPCPMCGRWQYSVALETQDDLSRELRAFRPVVAHVHPVRQTSWQIIRRRVGKVYRWLRGSMR